MKLSSSRRLIQHLTFVLILAFAVAAFGARSDVDPTFNPMLTSDATAFTSGNAIVLPGGKILLFGGIQGSATIPSGAFIYRANSDGSIDSAFDSPAWRQFAGKIVLRDDGKFMVGISPAKVYRLFSDGSLDLSFKIPPNTLTPSCVPTLIIALPGGKTLVGCSGDRIFRLNENGSLDPTYTQIVLQGSPTKVINESLLLPDGKLLIGGGFSSGSAGWLARYNADGTLDNTFQANPSHSILGLGLLTDGRYIVTGNFLTMNGVNKSNYATLFTDGSVDTSFTASRDANDFPRDVRTLPNGQFYVFTRHSFFPTPTEDSYRFVRHNANGSIDGSFTQFVNNTFAWTVDGDGRIITHKSYSPGPGRYLRVNFDGTLDAGFNPVINAHGQVEAAARQSDGKLIIMGQFQKANGAPSPNCLRLHPDGTVDPTFNAGTGFGGTPSMMAVQSDGKILAIGPITGYNFFARPKFVRINPDGSADTSFTPTVDLNINTVLPLANGKILIGGNFTMVNGVARPGFARLNSDGSLDNTFAPVFGGVPEVFALMLQSDGKLMVGGTFGSVDGVTTRGVVRFKSDGTVDQTFIADTSYINHIAQRSDGKYIVAQRIFGGNQGGIVFRLYSNGPRDHSFTARGGGNIESLVLQPSGNIVYGFPAGMTRIGPNGEKDIYFPVYGANDGVHDILQEPNGKLIVAGDFSGIEDVGRTGIARLTLSNRIKGTPFDFDGDGRSDVSVYRPSTNTWYEILSGSGTIGQQTFGAAGDLLAPADYDGDGKTDLGLYRPSIGDFLYIESSTNTVVQTHWGQSGDIPMPADYNLDGRADVVIYRPSTGTWFGGFPGSLNFGAPGDQPVIGDFDGDGKTDYSVFRPSTGDWWYAASSTPLLNFRQTHWGATGDLPVPADYDGDSITDFAVFRPSDGGWYINNSSDGSFTILAFGTNGDRPAPGDYDGDGRADIAVFRPSTGIWYLYMTTSGFAGLQFGLSGDIPTPNAYVP